MYKDLKRKTITGIIWSSIERFSAQGIQFIFSLAIARQLLPSDYGVIAMLGIFMALAQSFIDSGFSNALIQKQNPTQSDCSTVFYFNVLIGIIFYSILFYFAPYIAKFYQIPLLKEITIWCSLSFVINSFTTVQNALLFINLDFKRQTWISLISVITSSIIAILMAHNGYGVWTLVWQNLINNFLNAILLWISSKWIPSLIFSWKSFSELFGFGSKLLMGGLLHTIYLNLYSLFIGRFFSATDLGLFNRASSIAQYPSINATSIITRVTYPIECSLKNDYTRLEEKFIIFIRLTAFAIFPAMIGLAVLSEPLIRLILTDKWLAATPLIQIMSFAYMLHPIMKMNWDLLNACHRSDYSLKSEILKKIVAFIILFITIPFGLKIMCIGLIIYSICDLFIITLFTKKILHTLNFKREVRALLPCLSISIIMSTCIYLFRFIIDSDICLVLSSLVFGLIIYIFLHYLCNTFEYQYIRAIIKHI